VGQRIYCNVVHDKKRFGMERQMHLLAKAGAAVWFKYMEQAPALKTEGDPMFHVMRELFHQLDKTDIFMGGLNTALEQED
jgi:hypothetical protein